MQIPNLPAPSSPPKEVPPDTVVLYADANWTGESLIIKTKSFAPRQRHSLSGGPMQDKATWVAFNLPDGVVMTLVDHYVSGGPNGFGDLKDAGKVVDLIGTGKTEAVDLSRCNMNDCVSAFFWRNVDLSLGALELFEDVDFKGNRALLFPSEWSAGKVISLSGWYIDGRLSSARWNTLKDTQSAALFDHIDGTGKSYANISGYGDTREIKNFNNVGFNDCASAFQFVSLAPQKEEIAKFDINLTDADVGTDAFVGKSSGTNKTSVPSPHTVTVNETDAETMTVTVSDSHTAGSKLVLSYGYKVDGALLGEHSMTASLELSYAYTHNATTSKSATKTRSLSVSQTFNAPPFSSYTGELIVRMGKLTPRPFSTTAKRWYSEPLPNTVLDKANNWYMREEQITGTVEGRLACKSHMEVESREL